MSAIPFDFPIDANAEHFVDLSLPGLIVDNFAGGGGASTGIEAGLGRIIDMAFNHDEGAIGIHKANHPRTKHYCQSVWSVDPREVVGNRTVDLAWFSPDCKHFSKAKGGTPVEKHIRDLAWVVVHWATRLLEVQRPKVIMLENVEEFRDWGPLIETEKGIRPCLKRKGDEFRRWIRALKKAGYNRIQWRELKAAEYEGETYVTRTRRKRLYLIARRDGHPIVWPQALRGDPKSIDVIKGRRKPWFTAADCIDWDNECPSIFDRLRPLTDNTCRRIAAGIVRYVINAAEPFIVPLTHHGGPGRAYATSEPLVTVTGAHRGELALVEPFIVPVTHTKAGGAGTSAKLPLGTITTAKGGEFALVEPLLAPLIVGAGGSEYAGKPKSAGDPMGTLTTNDRRALVTAELERAELVAAWMAQHNGGYNETPGHPMSEPLSTVTQRGTQQQIVTSHLVKLRGTCADGQPTDEPMPTVTAGGLHVGEVRTRMERVAAFLCKYYGNEENGHGLTDPIGTVTTRDRFALVTVTIRGEQYVIVDIGMRMLTPRELARAQGFPDSYILDPECHYRTESGVLKFGRLPKTHQVAKIGNSVCPAMAEVLVRANCHMYAANDNRRPAPEKRRAA